VTHRFQTIPFFAGIAMMVEYVMIFSALHHMADESKQPRLMVSLVATAVYAALVLFNYLPDNLCSGIGSSQRPRACADCQHSLTSER
jgi:hypothetical protein